MSNALGRKLLPRMRWTTLLNLILAGLLCWQLAQWTWLFLAPIPTKPAAVTPPPPDPERLLDTIRAAHLFGGSGQAASPAMAQATTALDLKLRGVFATDGRLPAVAIIRAENRGDLPFGTGDAVLPGVTLEQVWPDHVVLSRGGAREKLFLEQKGTPVATPQGKAVHLNVRREGKGHFGISRGELNQVLSDPALLAGAGRIKAIPGQGVRVEAAVPGSLLNRLGLQGGDIIHRINDKSVEKAADLLGEYQASNNIRMEGTRNGQPFEYNYTMRQ